MISRDNPGDLYPVQVVAEEIAYGDTTRGLTDSVRAVRRDSRGAVLTAAPAAGATHCDPHPCARSAWGDARAAGRLHPDRGDVDISRWAGVDARATSRRGLAYSRTSSTCRLSFCARVAFRMIRRAVIVRPCFPMTFPMSSFATDNSMTTELAPSTPCTRTWSGWSTIALAMSSMSVSIASAS